MKKLSAVIVSLLMNPVAFGLDTIEGAKKDIESFKQEMSIQLDKVEADIDRLQERAKEKKDQALTKTVNEYEKTRQKLKTELDKLQADASNKWKDAKKDLSDSVGRLNEKIQKTLNQ